MELLGFHLQMKTTWPAAWVRWKPDGRNQGRAAGSLGQRPQSHHLSTSSCPLASPACKTIVVNPSPPPMPRQFQDTGFSHPGRGQPRRCDPEPRKSDQQLDCALDLMRRLPPQQIEKNLSDLIDLVPSLCEDLLSSVDQPLKIARDKVVGKDYLLCDYNRDGDSYRSPWSNKYDPPLEDGAMPSARLRKLEVEANNAFDQYRDLYFEGGVSSVYLWDLDHGFAGVILIKKAGDGSKKIKGCWDSIHVVEVQEKSSGRTAHYKLTSTVMLWLQTNKSGSGTMNLGGSLTRQMEKDETVGDCSPHIANIGRLVEVCADFCRQIKTRSSEE
ncbi:PREDICTED: F-actin-capping protein subunit beta isoform X3 [Mandrillus leucophaeus]|nr:PREDICTED: F-actin-capping protein subunit beta isoform X3 [Mandrillus leucophaeus]